MPRIIKLWRVAARDFHATGSERICAEFGDHELNAVENPLVDPVVLAILVLVVVGIGCWLAAIGKAGRMFAGLSGEMKLGVVAVTILGGILIVLVAMLSRW